MKRSLTTVAALAVSVVAGLVLTACGSDVDSTGTARAENWTDNTAYIYAVKVRLDDEHVVPCISRSGGGMSCDWSVLHTPSPEPKAR